MCFVLLVRHIDQKYSSSLTVPAILKSTPVGKLRANDVGHPPDQVAGVPQMSDSGTLHHCRCSMYWKTTPRPLGVKPCQMIQMLRITLHLKEYPELCVPCQPHTLQHIAWSPRRSCQLHRNVLLIASHAYETGFASSAP